MDCCMSDELNDRSCPECGTTGRQVGAAPVQSHTPAAIDGPWSFCPNNSCRIVFFLDADVLDDDDVVARVGTKAASKPEPVCFCFAHTAADIADDLTQHGRSMIKESVKTAVADGLCACEFLNPTGTCCLPALRRALHAAHFLAAGLLPGERRLRPSLQLDRDC